jgi:hypothetical protein
MNTLEINKLLSPYKCYCGTFARDQLPVIKKRPCAIIMNTDTSLEPGEHWVAVMISVDNSAEYFDSFGFGPMHTEVIDFLADNKVTKLLYNKQQLQSPLTSTCGIYCVLFVKLRCQGISFQEFMQLKFNDKYVTEVI